MRVEGGARIPGHRQLARRRRRGAAVLHLLRRIRAVEPHRRHPRLRASGAGGCGGCAPGDSQGFAVHRAARPGWRIRDARAGVDGTGPTRWALRLPVDPRRRPVVGWLPEELGVAGRPRRRLHDALPVELGVHVPDRREASARGRHLPRVPRVGGSRSRSASPDRRGRPRAALRPDRRAGACLPFFFAFFLAAARPTPPMRACCSRS